jgi:hypothetical protein
MVRFDILRRFVRNSLLSVATTFINVGTFIEAPRWLTFLHKFLTQTSVFLLHFPIKLIFHPTEGNGYTDTCTNYFCWRHFVLYWHPVNSPRCEHLRRWNSSDLHSRKWTSVNEPGIQGLKQFTRSFPELRTTCVDSAPVHAGAAFNCVLLQVHSHSTKYVRHSGEKRRPRLWMLEICAKWMSNESVTNFWMTTWEKTIFKKQRHVVQQVISAWGGIIHAKTYKFS